MGKFEFKEIDLVSSVITLFAYSQSQQTAGKEVPGARGQMSAIRYFSHRGIKLKTLQSASRVNHTMHYIIFALLHFHGKSPRKNIKNDI